MPNSAAAPGGVPAFDRETGEAMAKPAGKAAENSESAPVAAIGSDARPGATGLTGLQALIERAEKSGRGPPPVERWNPPFCGDLDIVIRRDGTWFYLGTPIGRMPLVRLFAGVLRKDEDGRTYLVTPVEKVGITVEDAHFIAVEMDAGTRDGEPVLTFRTNVGDVVEAGPDHPLRFDTEASHGGVKPYLAVRGRLEALLSRAVTHQLMALGEEIEADGATMFAVRSAGAVFPIMKASELRRLAQGA